MVYIEIDKKLSKVKRHICSKLLPTDKKEIKRLIQRRKKYVAKEIVRDIRDTRKHEADKLFKAEDRLHKTKTEAVVKRANLVDQWSSLRRDEENFRSAFLQFHEYYVHNREKIEREKIKMSALEQGIETKDIAIKKIKEKIHHFQNARTRMNEEVNKHIIYEDFMKECAECTKVKNVSDILIRYALLLDSRDQMEYVAEERHGSMVEFSKVYATIIEEWKNTLLKFNEKLSTQSTKYEEAKRRVAFWEKTILDIELNAQKLWMEMEVTRDALDHVVCLLLIRMKTIMTPEFLNKDSKFTRMLSTTEGKILYMNKMLGDLMKVKEEFLEIYKEDTRAFGVHKAKGQLPPLLNHLPQLSKTKTETKPHKQTSIMKFPKISRGTVEILQNLEMRMKLGPILERFKLKGKQAAKQDETTSQMSAETASNAGSDEFKDPRARALTNWFITKEAIKEFVQEQQVVPETGTTLMTRAPHIRSNVPWSRRSGYLPERYSCVAITTDPSCKLVEEKRTRMRDRIIERNFDRLEKFTCKNLDTESSVMKINKETGKLELPKLQFKRNYQGEKKSLGISLPKIEPSHPHPRKLKKKKAEESIKSGHSRASASSRSAKSNRENKLVLESVQRLMGKPSIAGYFTFGNLS